MPAIKSSVLLGETQGAICVIADMQTNGMDLFIFQTKTISLPLIVPRQHQVDRKG
jgi:hypothetical protein